MLWGIEWCCNFDEVVMRFFNLRIVFVVSFLILLMSFVVLEYFVVDVGLFCRNYLVIGLIRAFLMVDFTEVK